MQVEEVQFVTYLVEHFKPKFVITYTYMHFSSNDDAETTESGLKVTDEVRAVEE